MYSCNSCARFSFCLLADVENWNSGAAGRWDCGCRAFLNSSPVEASSFGSSEFQLVSKGACNNYSNNTHTLLYSSVGLLATWGKYTYHRVYYLLHLSRHYVTRAVGCEKPLRTDDKMHMHVQVVMHLCSKGAMNDLLPSFVALLSLTWWNRVRRNRA